MDIYNGYEPHPKQRAWHQLDCKFKALITGVGFGKTAAGANEMLMTALKYPHAEHLITAPTSKIMENATLKEFLRWTPKEIIRKHTKNKNRIILHNGANIVYLTADNERHVDRWRGMEVGSWWPDEVRMQPAYTWEIGLTRLRDKNGPLKVFPTTTPAGYNWIYDYFVKKVHPKTRDPLQNPEDYAFITGSSLDNPHTPQEYKDNLLAQLTGKFGRQEVFGEFVGFEGQVYDNFKPNIHIFDKTDIEMKQMIVGIDYGFTNPFAMLAIGLDSDNRAYVLREFYRQRPTEIEVDQWLKLVKGDKKVTCYADPSEPAYTVKLHSYGHNVVPANNDVMPGINTVYSRLEVQKDGKPRLYIHRSCQNLIDEINKYRYASIKEGKEQKEQPVKAWDHALDGMRYALHSYDMGHGQYIVLKGGGGFF